MMNAPMKPFLFFVLLTLIAPQPMAAAKYEMQTPFLRIVLDTADGIPRIASIAWRDGADILHAASPPAKPDAWLPADTHLADTPAAVWQHAATGSGTRAEASRLLDNGLAITWIIEAPETAPAIRMHVRVHNTSNAPIRLDRFPAWNAAWNLPGRDSRFQWWKALSFENQACDFAKGSNVALHSRVHSSDAIDNGVNPYWMASGKSGSACLSLEWCGGWEARFQPGRKALMFDVYLPESETALTLNPNESIDGPVLHALFTQASDPAASRAEWARHRIALARELYGTPAPVYPFCWNHWYTVRFNIDQAFLRRQIDALAPYHFDYFIVDAGWYKACGEWTPDPAKFEPGAFERAMKDVAAMGVKPGIWTCPQFVKASKDALPPEVDQPGFYRDFIDGYLLDMAGMDFTSFLLDHVRNLQTNYGARWWKYDQDFFTANATRAGRMKNVIALQNALAAVRRNCPDLYIENCQSGGRMLNEFTMLLAQGQWICDGGKGGLERARRNLNEAVNALEFIPPWSVIRWVNRPEEDDPNDDEFTRMYCRSAMPGVWGLVSDLAKLSERQRAVILQEAANYRRLNTFKQDNLYDLYPARPGAPAAGITYFAADGSRAAVLLLRWDAKGPFEFPVSLQRLKPDAAYRIETPGGESDTLNTGQTKTAHTVKFGPGELSKLVFIEQ